MRLTICLAVLFTFCAFIPASSQQVNLDLKDASLREAFRELKRQTGIVFVYSEKEIDQTSRISARIDNLDLEEALKTVLKGLPYSYEWVSDMVVIRSNPEKNTASPQEDYVTVRGVVKDTKGQPIPGVTVMVKGTSLGSASGADGSFALRVTKNTDKLLFTFIGMKSVEITLNGRTELSVVLEEDTENIDEVVVTGIYQRNKESFTGSSATYTARELKMVGNQNVLQSLKTLEPAFAIVENNDFGSDPNTLPDIEIRGKTSIMGLTEEFESNPNQPLFVVDGSESTLAYVMDMSMDMIESITILKDAASTAIWGSKAANGVIVIETRAPEAGKLKFNYNGNFNISFPDLSDYNLMNAEEKLRYELLSIRWGLVDENGTFTNSADESEYMVALKKVLSGVDTYWLHIPLRVGFTNKHTVFVEGGINEIRYGMGLSYGHTQGVMIGSTRETVNGNFRLTYRTGNLFFKNILNIDNLVSERENVEFSRFALMNPYLRKYDEYGEVIKYYYMRGTSYRMDSPLWDMELGSFNRSSDFQFSNSFEVEWNILKELRARGRISLGKIKSEAKVFKSPFHTSFRTATAEKTGSYSSSNDGSYYYNGDLSIVYGNVLNEVHWVNAVAGLNFREDKKTKEKYVATGFVDDEYPNPNFANGYEPDTSPAYSESTKRSASYFFNGGYTYSGRYLLDVSFRMDGSSIFGVDNHFSTTWAVGIGWNIHNEAFMENTGVKLLKLRASVGDPGNQNFDDYISERVYTYSTDNPNKFGTAMTVSRFGNKDLKWQKTLDHNVGFDFSGLRNRLRVSFDYYYKKTDPLLVYIGIPSSTGVSSVPYNLAEQRTHGMNASVNFQIVAQRDLTWSVNATARSVRSKYHGLGNMLERYNEANRASNSLYRFHDGGSPNDLWAVRSAGIDPGTGREIFIKQDGTQTFEYDKADEVVVGNTEPDVEGVFGTRVYYKGLSVSFNFRYRLGGQAYMNALYDKVENVNKHANSMGKWYNQDKRALYDRWKNAGDDSKFLGIREEANPITSRFVMDNNLLIGESITLSYETQADWVRKIGASSFSFNAYTNDIFRVSTIKNERGIEYPFARSVSFSIGLRF